MIKTYLKSYLYLFILITIMTIILSIINYFIPKNMEIFKIIIPVIAMLIAAINLGKKVKNKAYLEGIKFSGIYLIFITIIRLIFKLTFSYKIVIMYILILIASILGCMIGINLKRD